MFDLKYRTFKILQKWFTPLSHRFIMLDRFVQFENHRRAFQSRPDDVWIVTYPKSGTTWMINIVFQIIHDKDLSEIDHIARIVPHFEEPKVPLHPPFPQIPSPRIIKTHLRPDYLPEINGKIIYVVRNGLDVAVSYYYHHLSFKPYNGPFGPFMEGYLTGQTAYHDWFGHVRQWSEHKERENFLFVQFETLKDQTEQQIRRVAEFLGKPLAEDHLKRVIQRTSFEYMRRHEDKMDLIREMLMSQGLGGGHLIREGKNRNWQSLVSPEQEKKFLDLYEEKLSDIETPYDDLMAQLRTKHQAKQPA